MVQRSLVLIISGLAFFTGLYRFFLWILTSRLLPHAKETVRRDLCVRTVNAIQGILAVVVGCITMQNTYDDIIYTRYQLLEDYFLFASFYFYYDTWAMYQVYTSDVKKVSDKPAFTNRLIGFIKENPTMLIHHLVVPIIYGPILVFWRNGKGDYLVGCLMMMEATVPFIAARFILLLLDLKNTGLYILNGVLLTVSFALCRIALWFYLVHIYAVFKNVTFISAFYMLPKICICGTTGLLAFNVYWFVKILYKFIFSVKKLLTSTKPKSM